MNSQTLFTNTLRQMVEARGLVLAVDQDWANTGTFRAVRAADLAVVFAVRYSFQSDYATFTVERGTLDQITARGLGYCKHENFGTALAAIVGLLPAQKPTKRAPRKA